MHPSLRPAAAVAAALCAAAPASAQYVLANHVDVNNAFPIGVDDAEFTPDGRMVVARDNTIDGRALFFDAKTGALIHQWSGSGGGSGPCEDGVGLTNERAVVLTTPLSIFDLNNLAGGPLATHNVGGWPRDVVVTPDGTMAAVHGGESFPGGLYLFDLATGALLAQTTGQATPWQGAEFEVDSVVADDEHAVFTSWIQGGSGDETRVTIFDLHPVGGGPPTVVYETSAGSDQVGFPHDLAITPDGRHAAVRSQLEVGLYRLDGQNSTQLWKDTAGSGDNFGKSAMDSLEVTDDRICSISRRVSAGIGAAVDVWELDGTNYSQFLVGDPHDLTIVPGGERLAVRTHEKIYLFDIANLPAGSILQVLDEKNFTGNWTSWSAGLDSIVAHRDRILAISRDSTSSKVRLYDISNDTLDKLFGTTHNEPVLDLTFTPDGTRAVLAGWSSALVVDLRLGKVVLDFDSAPQGGFPWCDAVASTNDQAVAFGYIGGNFAGWITVIDLFSAASRFCKANPNVTGRPAGLVTAGSPRVGANDLVLWAHDLPPGSFGQFFYGDQTTQTQVGKGVLCVTGQAARFAVQSANQAGLASTVVDNTNLPPSGGAITAGTTWHFQYVYRDKKQVNLSDAVSVLFEN